MKYTTRVGRIAKTGEKMCCMVLFNKPATVRSSEEDYLADKWYQYTILIAGAAAWKDDHARPYKYQTYPAY